MPFCCAGFPGITHSGANETLRYPFTKADRLLKRKEFIRLSRFGKKFHTGHFLALYQPGAAGRTRLGITVTKKVANAPGRNRIKRLVRENFRHNRLRMTGCWDINIVAKQKAARMSSIEAFDDLNRIFTKISQENDNQKDHHRPLPHRS